ncbi:hypothetical protein CFOL_v3_09122 [Cephalotus follicularis]|uniref:Protein CHUP1, chloroplastic-like n=1 Tax=Cephalotus follicularis TaxID=3775 RepID=A0A1Q3BC38_CEPFO|nr:hypothetical protein CFOL_v3_09122 [Cephalotus follicularis]
MREEIPSESRAKPSKYSDQNQAPKNQNAKNNANNHFKPRSSWGSNIVKGFTADKKTKQQTTTTTITSKKLPPINSDTTTLKTPLVPSQSRAKRSLIGDLSCSVNATQVHPQEYSRTHHRQSSGSRDLFIELDHLRSLLQESKEREFKLQAELSEYKSNLKVFDCERETETRRLEVDELTVRVGLLESEKNSLREQLPALSLILEPIRDGNESSIGSSLRNLEMEVVELRRLNKELQLQKRNLVCKLSSIESQLASLAKSSQSDIVEKIKAEASMLRNTNEDLCKQVEGLQMSRLNEVEELAYLRWVNSCLRDELRSSCSTVTSDEASNPSLTEKDNESVNSYPCQSNNHIAKNWNLEEGRSPSRRHSISGSKCCMEDLVPSKRRQSDGFIMSMKGMEKETELSTSQKYDPGMVQIGNYQEANKISIPLDVDKKALRIPNPPPRPSCAISSAPKEPGSAQIQPPPPPPPPPLKFSAKNSTGVVQRAPQVVEFYHSLMKRDCKKDSSSGGIYDAPDVANVRSSMIGEIENRSSYLLSIKADVETQGEFVNSLIREVKSAVYPNIEDVVAFVKWLDDELCFLVDERAVLKHFDWPEKKADILREAAFGYRDLKKLESEVSYYKDDPLVPCDIALKKMVALSEKMERTVHNLLRTRDSLMRNCKEFQIPTDWMLDNGIISKVKLGSVKLAKKYMKRVAMELQSKAALEKDPAMDYMLLQGVRFAFRIHQFAGGFDAETMHAFEELRNLAHLLNKKSSDAI